MMSPDFDEPNPHSRAFITARRLWANDGPSTALKWLSQSPEDDRNEPDALHLAGQIWLKEENNPTAALCLLEEAVSKAPKVVVFRATLAECLCRLERPKQALEILRRIPPECRERIEVNDVFATAFSAAGMIAEYIAALRRATELGPDDADRTLALADELVNADQSADARKVYLEAVKRFPQNAIVAAHFGSYLIGQGQIVEAIRSFERALEIKPDDSKILSVIMFYRMFISDTTRDDLLRCGRKWDAIHRLPSPLPGHTNRPDPLRPLKIGYVSGDLVWHSVSYFFHPLLVHRDRSQFKVYCYSNTPQVDSRTTMLRGQVDEWRDITGIEDRDAAELIRNDEIDILLDMSGHMKNNRLPLFSLRPAPVQVGWQGYVGSRFIKALDYWITDDITDPPEESLPAECGQPLRIPGGYHLYEPDPESVFPIPPLPCERNGCVTFGSFNQHGKIQPETVQLWAQVLAAVSGSRLMLKGAGFSDPYVVQRFRRMFTEEGVAEDRLLFVGPKVVRRHHFELYGQVDIALDTFPHHGITTTCEALWMGVPVIVLMGNRTESRVGAGLLQQMGLGHWVATDPADYVRIAEEAAADPIGLSQLRHGMRDRMRSTQLGDPQQAVPRYEAALRHVWQEWCRSITCHSMQQKKTGN